MTNDDALIQVRIGNSPAEDERSLHGEATDDHQDHIKGKDGGDTECKTKDDAQHTSPRFC
jgi:hypothetical protein